MAASNVQSYRVFGPAIVYTGTGTNNAMEALGVTETGADIRLTRHRRPVYSDIGGPEVPAEMQEMGETGRISFTLISYKEDVLRRIAMMSKIGVEKVGFVPGGTPNSTNFGAITPRGRLIGTDGGLFRVFFPPALSSANTQYEDGWLFPTCDLDVEPETIKIGTVVIGVRLSLAAIPFIAGAALKIPGINTDGAMSKIYTRTSFAEIPV